MYLCTTELLNLLAVLGFLSVIKSHKMTIAYLYDTTRFFFRLTRRNVYNQIDEIKCMYN